MWPSQSGVQASGITPGPARAWLDVVAAGLRDVRMVQQPVNDRGGQVLGQLVERGGVQAPADHEGALLVGPVDEQGEPFGGVRTVGEQADVVEPFDLQQLLVGRS